MFFVLSFLIMGLIYGYVEWRFVSLLEWSLWIRVVISLLLVPAVFNLWVVLFFGDVLPQWIIKFISGLQVFLIFLFTATFLIDLSRFIVPVAPWFLKVVFCVLMGASVFAVLSAQLPPRVKKVEIQSSLFQSETPLKIAQLSDLHIGQGFGEKWLETVIEKTNALNPDLILITGDLVDKSPEELGSVMQKLKLLKASLGVYIVFGNHEAYHQSDKWRLFFKNNELQVLNNEHKVIDFMDQKIILGGIDFGARYTDDKAEKLLEKTFSSAPDDGIRLLMAHHPHVFSKAAEKNVVLQLSGHTHGGMVFPVDLLVKLSNKGFLRGIYKKGNSRLYVSNGTGLWGGFPARFISFNEITLILLKGVQK